MNSRTDNNQFDVIIVGGSYAGLSAAMSLGRSLKQVLIIDNGQPCNRFTTHSQNFLTRDGEPPQQIARIALDQVLEYSTVALKEDTVLQARQVDGGFELKTATDQFFAKKLLLATGIRDILPSLKGFKEAWGKTIVHCPYCHGFEFKGQKTGLWASGAKAFHLAALVNNLTDNLTIVTADKTDFSSEEMAKFEKYQINIIEKEVVEIAQEEQGGPVFVFGDGTRENFDAVYAVLPFEQQSDLFANLGCELIESGHIKVDSSQRTSVQGVYACGDNCSPMRSVANAVATGNLVGAIINHELTTDMF